MKDIVPLAYELKKAQPQILSNEVMYRGMIAAYKGGSIGMLSNDITKVWNTENIGEEQFKVIKWLTYIVNQNIDYAKCLWKAIPPKEVAELIHSYTRAKTPYFFIYAKDKAHSKVEAINNSAMNKITKNIPDGRIIFNKSISKFNYHLLMNFDSDFDISPDNDIIKCYDYWNARINSFVEDKSVKNQDMYKYHCLRNKIIEETGKSVDYIVNTLIDFLYTVRKTSAKKGLWDGFGDVIVSNLKKNLEGAGKICPVCGKRFIPLRNTQNYCSTFCYNEAKKYRGKTQFSVTRKQLNCTDSEEIFE